MGVPDGLKGQRVVVFTVMREDWSGDLEALTSEVRERIDSSVGKAFRPSVVHVVGDLPKTRSSKVMRRVIRDLYSGRQPGDLTSLANPPALAEIERAASAT